MATGNTNFVLNRRAVHPTRPKRKRRLGFGMMVTFPAPFPLGYRRRSDGRGNLAVEGNGIDLRFESGVWIGTLSTRFGVLEVVVGGSQSAPDQSQLDALRRFQSSLDDNIRQLWGEIRFSFLWRPIRLGVNNENRVGVQFRNRITGNQGKLILQGTGQKSLRAVPGAMAYSIGGKVAYNLLTPHMQQFMGRCIGAIKKAGIAARGTRQFSIVVGDHQREVMLDRFYQPVDDPGAIGRVVAEAKTVANQS